MDSGQGDVADHRQLTSKTNNEGEIRKKLIENDLVDCIVNLPTKLFLNTQIPACLWFLRRNKQHRKGKSDYEIETAIKQVIDKSLSSDKVVDIFDAAGIDKPEVSILSDKFLLEVKDMKHKNLAFELLKKLLNNEITSRAKTNLVKSKALLEMLETAIKKSQNNLLSTAEIIQELIEIAREVRESDRQGEKLNLTKDEVAFYNALEINDSAIKVLGDETLRDIAREIADKVKRNATIDWTIRESARAKLMVLVRRTLSKYGYPPDKQQKAIDTVLKQAELLADSLVQI